MLSFSSNILPNDYSLNLIYSNFMYRSGIGGEFDTKIPPTSCISCGNEILFTNYTDDMTPWNCKEIKWLCGGNTRWCFNEKTWRGCGWKNESESCEKNRKFTRNMEKVTKGYDFVGVMRVKIDAKSLFLTAELFGKVQYILF